MFIGVFAMSREREIRKFAGTYRITFPVGMDNGIAGALGVRALPATVFITRDRKIAKRVEGRMSSAELALTIDAVLK
ncbi:MAG: hypothetical protein M1497_13045 [Nitrospirae bacterium]|nr:hypothetical protein [Nitrospirota bacterium]